MNDWCSDETFRDNYEDILCPYGRCRLWRDRKTRRIDGGVGSMTCPCDHTPGWRSAFIDGMGKPHPPVLPKGRHATRIARARQIRRESDAYIADLRRILGG